MNPRVQRLAWGASVLRDGGTRFRVWAPRAERVSVQLGTDHERDDHPLEEVTDGVFEAVVEASPAGDYRYRLNGERLRPDPVSRYQPHGVHGASRVVDPSVFEWSDQSWYGLALEDLVFYELHTGTFTPEGTFDAVIERLGYLRDLGITALELMPVAQFPGTRNWGYDGVYPYAPQHHYGGPEGLRRLVNAAHTAGLAVFLDVVYNHVGPEGNYLEEYGPYFTDTYGTPWGRAVNFDGPGSDHVRRYVIDNALYWVTEFHFDGLRLDAVHSIFDQSARHILAELADAVHRQGEALQRRLHVIAESDLNDPRLVRPRACGGFELDAQWNEDFHHAVHAALTGERNGYYCDFGGVEPIAHALRDRFHLAGGFSRHRGRRHGAPAKDVPPPRFVAFAQNHDQIGNRAEGNRLGTLVSPEAERLAAALLLLSPYLPLIFMGEEYGETNPFLYFVDHGDPALLQAVRDGRREEFSAFGWNGDPPDPAAPETFVRSCLSWNMDADARRQRVRRLYRDLLTLRRTEPALRPKFTEPEVEWDAEQGWLTLVHTSAEGRPVAVAGFNLSNGERHVAVPRGAWQRACSTDETVYGGGGGPPDRIVAGGQLTLAPSSAALYLEAH